MKRQTVLFLHGFASSGRSTKAGYLRDRCEALPQIYFHSLDFNPSRTDFEYLTVTGMINRVRQFTIDRAFDRIEIIGSSLGALVGLHFAYRYKTVSRLLLLAPALTYTSIVLKAEMLEQWKSEGRITFYHYGFEESLPLLYDFHQDAINYGQVVPPPAPVTIIHGKSDDVVPIESSREYASRYPDSVRLIETDSDHLLADRLDLIWEQVNSFLLP